MIDDSPSGIEGASAAGIRSLGFIGTNRLGKPWETALMAAGAQDLISSFDELLLKLGLCGKFQSCTNDNTALNEAGLARWFFTATARIRTVRFRLNKSQPAIKPSATIICVTDHFVPNSTIPSPICRF